MAAAGPSKALKSVTKLANTPKTSRIELALALADLDDEPGAVADFITTMPTKLRTTYASWRSVDGLGTPAWRWEMRGHRLDKTRRPGSAL